MSFSVRFSETQLERDRNRLRLVGRGGEVLLDLRGHEIDEAVRAGFLNRDDYHFSMFEYARIRAIPPPLIPVASGNVSTSGTGEAAFDDRRFLAEMKISWD